MSETTTTAAVETTEATPRTSTAPKRKVGFLAKIDKARATKKAKAAAKPSANGHSDGLRKPQVRILKALSRNTRGLTRAQIAEKAEVPVAMTDWVGPTDSKEINACDKKYGFKSLLSLGLIKIEQDDVNGKDVFKFFITAKGAKTAAAK